MQSLAGRSLHHNDVYGAIVLEPSGDDRDITEPPFRQPHYCGARLHMMALFPAAILRDLHLACGFH